ncbi:MAG: hypothetical protein DRG78_13745 [Epsilonproteobacteria bacterium]|nr:MAG: hypothetical protein DRG78_13745 [Campylobacterota bacterium]
MKTAVTMAEKIEIQTKEEQRILANNAWHLARYAIEHDHEIDFPDEFDIGQFLYWSENYPNLNPEEKITFVNQYAMLERTTKSVTARTLYATRIYGRGFTYAIFNTSVGKYLLFLSSITILFILILIADSQSVKDFMMWIYEIDYCIPAIFIAMSASGLGTCVFLLRVTQQKLRTREFDPAYIPSQLIRLGLGVFVGALIILFPSIFDSADTKIDFQLGALAFILGYAIDIFYAILDNIGGRVQNRK